MANEKRLTWKRSLDGYEDVGLREGVTVGEAICKLADLEEKGTVEVVRCKDCKFYELKCFPDGKMKMNCENNKGIWTNTPPDAFCSYGERRDND